MRQTVEQTRRLPCFDLSAKVIVRLDAVGWYSYLSSNYTFNPCLITPVDGSTAHDVQSDIDAIYCGKTRCVSGRRLSE